MDRSWKTTIYEKLIQTSTYTGTNPRVVQTTFNTGKVFEETLFKQLWSVDPIYKVKAGPYVRKHVILRSLPSVQSSIKYRMKDYRYPNDWCTKVINGALGSYILPSVGFLTVLNWNQELLINRSLKGIREECINLAVFMTEIQQTMALISGASRRIAAASDAVKGNKFKKAAVILGIKPPKGVSYKKQYANNILAYKMGVIPLVSDCIGAAQHLASRARALTLRSRSRLNTFPEKVRASNRAYITQVGVQDEFTVDYKCDGVLERFEQVTLEYALSNAFWDEASRLGMTNTGAATWEALPYSFVVDTFLNLGDWLSDMDQGLGLELAAASYTQGYRIDGVVEPSGRWSYPNTSIYKDFTYMYHADKAEYQVYGVQRIPLGATELKQTLLFRSPLSVNNAINDTALVVQRLKRT